MPVNIEWIDKPSDQDWIDLEKLYKDAPHDWLPLDSEQPAHEFISTQLKEGRQVAAGRFNDRLIATAVLTSVSMGGTQNASLGETYNLQRILVRKLTRDRGVAKQLLVRLCQWADDAKFKLCVYDDDQSCRVLLEFGFFYEKGTWLR